MSRHKFSGPMWRPRPLPRRSSWVAGSGMRASPPVFSMPEKYRQHDLELNLYGTPGDQGNGVFMIPSPVPNRVLFCIASDGEGWEHVSVSARRTKRRRIIKKLPSWYEMCRVRRAFWGGAATVIQYHPPESANVNNAEVLHLWRPVGVVLPLPPGDLVGIPDVGPLVVARR